MTIGVDFMNSVLSTDTTFVEGCKGLETPEEILNWYRNLYRKEHGGTEQYIVVRALDAILPKYFHQKLQKDSADCIKTLADNAVKSTLKSEMSKLLDCFETCLKEQYLFEDTIFTLRCEMEKMKGASENE